MKILAGTSTAGELFCARSFAACKQFPRGSQARDVLTACLRLHRQHRLQVRDGYRDNFVRKLPQLRRDAAARGMGNDDATPLVLGHTDSLSKVSIARDQDRAVVHPTLSEADQVQHDECIDTLLLPLRAKAEMLLELRQRDAAGSHGTLYSMVPGRHIFPNMTEPQLNARAASDGVECGALRLILRMVGLKSPVIPVSTEQSTGLTQRLGFQPGYAACCVGADPPGADSQGPRTLRLEIASINKGCVLRYGLSSRKGKGPQRGPWKSSSMRGTHVVCRHGSVSVNVRQTLARAI